MIIEKNQNIFFTDAESITHCCNTFCVWGAGIAKEMKMRYPSAYHVDLMTECGNKEKLGNYSLVWLKEDEKVDAPNLRGIYNLYGQHYYGTHVKQLSYDALHDGMIKVLENCKTNNIKTLAIPYKIGAGLAGGNWNIIMEILKSIFEKEKDFTLIICRKD